MNVTLLDTKTGQTVDVNDSTLNAFIWCEGNWSCDCNRVRYFPDNVEDEILDEMRKYYPNSSEEEIDSTCYMGRRIIIIAPEKIGDYDLREANSSYPKELLDKWLST